MYKMLVLIKIYVKQYLICFILFLYFNSIFNKGSSFATVMSINLINLALIVNNELELLIEFTLLECNSGFKSIFKFKTQRVDEF